MRNLEVVNKVAVSGEMNLGGQVLLMKINKLIR